VLPRGSWRQNFLSSFDSTREAFRRPGKEYHCIRDLGFIHELQLMCSNVHFWAENKNLMLRLKKE
jgi:hypothetical protein